MDEQTLKAIEHGIAKWKQNCLAVHPRDVDDTWNTCSLCKIYYPIKNSLFERCLGCPVYMRSKEPVCDGTPYAAVSRHRAQWMRAIYETAKLGQTALINLHKEKCLEACRQEVDFLCSLLPLDHKDYVAFDLDSYLAST